MQNPVSTCKAWQFFSNGLITDSLAIKDIPIPSAPSRWSSLLGSVLRSYGPHPGVLIRVAAASLNPVDYKMIYPGSPAFIVRKPGVPGSDFSGVVVSALKGGNKQLEAVGLAPGMRVYGYILTEWRMLLVRSGCKSRIFRTHGTQSRVRARWQNTS
jgi:NADPH:quinone reductase-like Zn-dependent oxidoreductase